MFTYTIIKMIAIKNQPVRVSEGPTESNNDSMRVSSKFFEDESIKN
jgi:hypothetical protein